MGPYLRELDRQGDSLVAAMHSRARISTPKAEFPPTPSLPSTGNRAGHLSKQLAAQEALG